MHLGHLEKERQKAIRHNAYFSGPEPVSQALVHYGELIQEMEKLMDTLDQPNYVDGEYGMGIDHQTDAIRSSLGVER